MVYALPMTEEAKARAALKALIKQVGGKAALADALGVRPQAVQQWDLLPLAHLRTTRQKFGLGLKELRPDVWELAK